jgi:Bacterial protein of unknown function (DUF922)
MMGSGRLPGALSHDVTPHAGDFDPQFPTGGFEFPGPIGLDSSPVVTEVKKDWEPPNPSSTPAIVVKGKTLAQVAVELNRLPEWGRGGGSLRSDKLENVKTPEVTVQLRANLTMVLPRWEGYEGASEAAKIEWNRMIEKLREHEQRHVDIAIEEADALASALLGKPMSNIASMVTEANAKLARRQQELDAKTEQGSKEGVQFGDVVLDTSVK